MSKAQRKSGILRRIMGFLTAVILLGCTAAPTAAAEVSAGMGDAQIPLLVGLGIMQGGGNGNLNLEAPVTRGEFAAMICRTMGLSAYTEQQKFLDVQPGHWAFAAVQGVSDQGYLVGDADGNFRPDAPILMQEAAKVLVAVLGYGYPAAEDGGYPAGYLSTARKIGVLAGMDLDAEKQLSRGETARMFYNSLHIKLMRQTGFGEAAAYEISSNSTLLSDYLKVTDVRGTIRANHWVNLDGEYEIAEDQVVIGDKLYYAGNTDIAGKVGYSVHAYVKMDGNNPVQTVLYYEEDAGQNTVAVDARDISESTTAERFVYMDGDRTREVAIPKNVVLIWNGRSRFSFDAETLKPKTGSVALVMHGSKPAMIRVSSFESRVVQSVSEGTRCIYYKNDAPPTDLEDPDIQYSILKMDRKAGITDLEENDIVSIAQSEDGMVVEIIVSSERMTGTVSTVSGDHYAIDGMSYPVSPYYSGKTLELGKHGTFYFDTFGEIVYAEYDSASRDYAYLLAAAFEDSLSPKLTLKLLTMAGKIEEIEVSQKLTFNDQRMDVKAAAGLLKTEQLLRVQLSAEGEVRRIWTARDNTSAPSSDYDPEEFSKDIDNKSMRYSSQMFSDGSELVCVPDNVPVLIVAKDRSNDLDERGCGVSTVSKTFSSSTTYSGMTFYDMNPDTRIPGLIVRKKTVGSSSVNSTNSVCVVDEIHQTLDAEGIPIQALQYYRDGQIYTTPVSPDIVSTRRSDNADSKNVPEVFKNVSFSDLQRGDVVQLVSNNDGELSVFRPLFVQKYAPADYTALVTNGGSGYSEFPTLETFYGGIVRHNTQIITMQAGGKEASFSCTKRKVYRLNRERGSIEVLTVDDLSNWVGRGDVFVHASRKACQVIVVYD